MGLIHKVTRQEHKGQLFSDFNPYLAELTSDFASQIHKFDKISTPNRIKINMQAFLANKIDTIW